MLKGLDPLLTPDLLQVLAAMGHGDELALVDRNFPAASTAATTVSGRLIRQDAVDTTRMAEAILSVLPLDSFVEAPVRYMQAVGEPLSILEVHDDLRRVAETEEGETVAIAGLERLVFYEAARRAYAVVQTGEARPYGCFLLRKGVIFD